MQKKNKTELQNLEGLYLLVVNVDASYIKKQQEETKAQVVDLMTNLKASTYGNAYIQVPC